MPRKTSPPEGQPVKRTAVKKKDTKKSTVPAKKAAPKKEPVKKEPEKNDNPPADKKPRPRSPINGVELPIGRPFQQGEEQRERARRAGKKSQEVQRARKTLRQELLDLLQVTSKDADGKDHTQQEIISAALIKEARGGNVRAYESIRDTIGEKQMEQVKVAVSLPKFEILDEAFSKMSGDDE